MLIEVPSPRTTPWPQHGSPTQAVPESLKARHTPCYPGTVLSGSMLLSQIQLFGSIPPGLLDWLHVAKILDLGPCRGLTPFSSLWAHADQQDGYLVTHQGLPTPSPRPVPASRSGLHTQCDGQTRRHLCHDRFGNRNHRHRLPQI